MPSLPSRFRGPRLQPLWEGLHKLALQGMNYGGGTDVASSGEAAFLAGALGSASAPLVLDVGANHGDYVQAVLSANPRSVVHAFEPSADVFAQIEGRFADHPNVSCWNHALGAEAGTATLHWPDGHDGLASLTPRDLRAFGLEVDHHTTVEVQTLDSWAAEVGIDHVDLLKVDVEGHEADVLRGASGLLERGQIERVQFEFGGTSIDTRTFLRDVFDALGPGWEVRRMLPGALGTPVQPVERNEIFVLQNYVALRSGAR
ncbi:MAG: methyltransferase, FkbM family [Ilumatobacteraceae bacterium]|nr:methyltransferase, FkbM family [Ilumatobacteraceae bacterium]